MRPKFENVDLFWGKMDIDILKLIYTYEMDSHRQTDLDIDLFSISRKVWVMCSINKVLDLLFCVILIQPWKKL